MRSTRDDELAEWILAALILIIALTPILILGWAYLRDRGLAKGFDKVGDGVTQQDVLRLMGKPRKIGKCGEFFGPIAKSEMEGCVSGYLNVVTFAPYKPDYYIARSNRGGQVIGKDFLSSP
ncbi:MAG TPA: hypothetical protein VGF61_13750 [Candidatus Acidoferrum sp.]|jgi:hypothetical protein